MNTETTLYRMDWAIVYLGPRHEIFGEERFFEQNHGKTSTGKKQYMKQ